MSTASTAERPSPFRTIAALGPAAHGGIVLVLCAIAALAVANSTWGAAFVSLWQTELRVGVGDASLAKPALLWINDGLMAVFFLLVGLEIKRELLEGALSSWRQAALPIFAAVGGMAMPALIYTVINANGGEPRGWAVPTATDIAFALGVLALLGPRVPVALKVFLTAVAVVDDLGAILVIAMFFTESLSFAALGAAVAVVAGLAVVNRAGVRHPVPYLLLGSLLWTAILKSGIHATVTGVLLALFIPAARHLSPASALGRVRHAVALPFGPTTAPLLPPDTLLHRVRRACDHAESPLHRWEHALQPWVAFGIMPLFALANAGVVVTGAGAGAADPTGTVSLGVAVGLLLGNPIGITLFSWLAVRGGLSELPAGVTWLRLHAASWLAGIGFTMSLFIAGLALEGAALAGAKLGLLLASAAASVMGASLLLWACRSHAASSERQQPAHTSDARRRSDGGRSGITLPAV